MVSLICSVSLQPSSFLNPNTCFLPVVMVLSPPNLQYPPKKYLKQRKVNQSLLGFSGFCGVARRCKSFEGESDSGLELELLEFMKNSRNPGMFPSKKELVDAGRGDLVDAIVKIGGWMTMGWGDEVEDEVGEDGLDSDMGLKYGSNGCKRNGIELSEERNCEGVSFLDDSSSSASSSGRSLEMVAEDDSGIEGILHRLERQRNLSFGLKSGNNGTATDYVNGTFDGSNLREGIDKDVDSCHLQRNGPTSLSHDRPTFDGNGLNRSYSNGFNSPKMDTWRTWSIQRAGFLDTEFEAGEIDFGENNKQLKADTDRPVSEVVAITTDTNRAQDEKKDLDFYYKEIVQGDLKARLQNLEAELSSALHVIKSNTTDLSGKVKENLPKDLRQLSDVSEFQENEIMNAQDKLRSLRARLAVLEGKMALAIVDAQKILDEKQKRINDARKALQLLRTTCIVWPNSGSEVLLSGSFDGWATQRKMTRSSTGVFSLFLKLYPGKYEIKFIVDGIWKVDPLRPIVNNNGFENNLLIIS